jgi:hypothetical protein
LRSGAVELLEFKVNLQYVPENKALKSGIVRVYAPSVVPHCMWELLVWSPGENFTIIKGVGHTKYIC